MIDLAAIAAADPGAVDRASVTPLASAPLIDDEVTVVAPFPKEAPSMPAPAPSVRAAAPAFAPPAPAQVAFLSAQAALASPPRRGSFGRTLGAIVGLAAIAAGAFFVVRNVQKPRAAVEAAAPTAAAVVAASPAAPQAVALAATPANDHGVDPLSLPKNDPSAAAGGHHASHAWKPTHAAQSLVAKAEPAAPKGEQEIEKPVVAKADPPAAPKAAPAPQQASALLNSIKQAAESTPAIPPPAAEAAPVPAAAPVAAAGNAASQRPSQGAVTSALGTVIPEARECLEEGDGVSRARVVFGSDGAVQSVSVSGFAEGKPSAACIQKALSKAHVPAFAEASYGATVTIRP